MQRTAWIVLPLTALLLAGCGGESDGASATDRPAPLPDPDNSPPTVVASPSAPASRSTTASPATTSSGGKTVAVFFHKPEEGAGACPPVERVERRIGDTEAVAAAALQELFAGPSGAEQGRGLTSLFGRGTAPRLLRSVHVDDKTAYLDLERAFLDINNISTTCGKKMALASIEATLTQFPTVENVRYAVEAEPATFYEGLGVGCPSPPSKGDRCDFAPFQR
jgi:spore germination protein GerM